LKLSLLGPDPGERDTYGGRVETGTAKNMEIKSDDVLPKRLAARKNKSDFSIHPTT